MDRQFVPSVDEAAPEIGMGEWLVIGVHCGLPAPPAPCLLTFGGPCDLESKAAFLSSLLASFNGADILVPDPRQSLLDAL